jgi:hypothetical protein
MIKIESKRSGQVAVGDKALMGTCAYVIKRTVRNGSTVTLTGVSAQGRLIARTYNAFDRVQVQVPVTDFGMGVL